MSCLWNIFFHKTLREKVFVRHEKFNLHLVVKTDVFLEFKNQTKNLKKSRQMLRTRAPICQIHAFRRIKTFFLYKCFKQLIVPYVYSLYIKSQWNWLLSNIIITGASYRKAYFCNLLFIHFMVNLLRSMLSYKIFSSFKKGNLNSWSVSFSGKSFELSFKWLCFNDES